MILRSGQPFTPTISRDIADTGQGSQRPNITGTPTTIGQPGCWFYVAANPACASCAGSATNAFALPANFTYSNAGAFTLRSGWLKNLDFSLVKDFFPTEGTKLEFRAESFNLTNTATFAIPTSTVDTSSGGVVTSTSNNPRQLQFALKFSF